VDYLLSTRHALHKGIDKAFRAAGVEISFPQRDIHVRSIRDALPVMEGTGGTLRRHKTTRGAGEHESTEETEST
jgi:small-conductance mechanosensitive channel